jgi:hypothetical protein
MPSSEGLRKVRGMTEETKEVDGVAGSFYTDVSALSIGEARQGLTDVDFADVCWHSLAV